MFEIFTVEVNSVHIHINTLLSIGYLLSSNQSLNRIDGTKPSLTNLCNSYDLRIKVEFLIKSKNHLSWGLRNSMSHQCRKSPSN